MLSQIKQGLFKLDVIDYHAILGVPIDADPKEIRLRYLKIVPKLHPDTCKAKEESEKEKANQVLSKLLNPAYEALSKEKTRLEHQLFLQQKAETIVSESRKITLISEAAKNLSKTGENMELMYRKLVYAFGQDQYQNLDETLSKIGQLSEINLVYLLYRQSKPQKIVKPIQEDSGSLFNNSGSLSVTKTDEPVSQPLEKKVSPLEAYLRRAEDYKNKQKYKEAILELRDALKTDPKNSTCHSLLGMVYLEQKNLSMAKIHINTALEINPQDPKAVEAKEALAKQEPKEKATGKTETKSAKTGNLGLFSGLFNSKKK